MRTRAARRTDRWWLLPLGACLAGLVLTVPFWLSDLDVRVAVWVRNWVAGDGDPSRRWWSAIAHHLPSVLTGVFGLGAIASIVAGLLDTGRGTLRPGLFVLLSLAVGCGLVTNALLKDRTGRPRPRDTVHLGGAWEYRPPWDLGVPGRGKSFPCGHATVPAMGFSLWLLWRRRRPRLAWWSLTGGAVLTAYVAAARMVVGAHWLSDVLWTLVVMVVVPAMLHRWLLGGGVRRAAVARTPMQPTRGSLDGAAT